MFAIVTLIPLLTGQTQNAEQVLNEQETSWTNQNHFYFFASSFLIGWKDSGHEPRIELMYIFSSLLQVEGILSDPHSVRVGEMWAANELYI